MKNNRLTLGEKRIIEDKGTEPPFSGEYNDFFSPGPMFAVAVIIHSTDQRQNINLTVAGQVLMMRSRDR